MKGLYGFFPDENACVSLWFYNPDTNRWKETDLLEGGKTRPIHGKPAVAFVPYSNQIESPGRLYFYYINHSYDGLKFEGAAKMMMSYVKVLTNADGTISKQDKIGLDSYVTNVSFYAYAFSVFYDREHDKNLRAAYSIGYGPTKYRVFFWPKADGINDFTYQNYNDWEVIRKIFVNGLLIREELYLIQSDVHSNFLNEDIT